MSPVQHGCLPPTHLSSKARDPVPRPITIEWSGEAGGRKSSRRLDGGWSCELVIEPCGIPALQSQAESLTTPQILRGTPWNDPIVSYSRSWQHVRTGHETASFVGWQVCWDLQGESHRWQSPCILDPSRAQGWLGCGRASQQKGLVESELKGTSKMPFERRCSWCVLDIPYLCVSIKNVWSINPLNIPHPLQLKLSFIFTLVYAPKVCW